MMWCVQLEWQYGKVVTKPLNPVSAEEFYQSFGSEWHHSLVVLPRTQQDQERLKVNIRPAAEATVPFTSGHLIREPFFEPHACMPPLFTLLFEMGVSFTTYF